ncbi:MAG: hypothetical protein R3B06_02445 [Kofleriaceae bacterium]
MRMLTRSLVVFVTVVAAACGSVSGTPDAGGPDAPPDGPSPDAPPVDAPSPDAPPVDAPPGARTLTVARTGTGTGTVTSSVGGLDCGAICGAALPAGTVVTLTATPAAGSTFAGWTGPCTGAAPTCTLTLTADTTVGAGFTLMTHQVVVSLAGNGLGTVSSTPAGISCPGTCTTTAGHGAVITLTAAAQAGSTFAGWSGACSGTGPCALTVDGDRAVTATFAVADTLVVTRSGAGTGTVTSSPAGITCGADCSETYPPNTTVTLTATPAAGSVFQGWSGGGCAGTGPCTLTVNGAVTVDAMFGIPQCTLTVARAGTGTGTVVSTPTGISCGATCAVTTACGTTFTLTATPAGASSFAGWSGGCTGTGTCTVALTSSRTVTATFTQAPVMPNLVFVTSTTTTGNIGGLAGADAKCQSAAAQAGLAGTYRAWLSTSTANAIDRLGTASGWTLVDGRPFANTKADLAAGRIFYPITLDETGAARPFNSAWTATNSDGTWISVDNACSNWTSTANVGVTAGSTLGASGSWTAYSGNPCTSPLRLYCFGIDRAASVTVTPVAGRRIFMSQAAWSSGGGVASADALCASEAAAAGLTGTFKALLATTTASAASRFSTTGTPWVRTDGIALTSTAAAMFASSTSSYAVAPNLTAGGVALDTNPRRYLWSGAADMNALGTAASTCSNWTSTSATIMPTTAELSLATPSSLFGGIGYQTCAVANRLMCLQQ